VFPRRRSGGTLRPLWHHLLGYDQAVLRTVASRELPRWFDRVMRGATHLGGAGFAVAVPLALLALPGTRPLGATMAVAVLTSHLAVQLLKRTVVRARPSVREPGIPALSAPPDAYSFPSGHAAAAMALALPVAFVSPWLALPAVTGALLVGASRVYLRVHYVTDVVVGQVLGAAAALGAGISLR
jgi:undecaprenyl-diphosphatase